MLTAAGLLVGIAVVSAQTPTYDTARRQPSQSVRPQSTQPTQKQPSTAQPSRSQSSQESNYQRDMTKMQSSDIPASLRSTLQGAEYKGWENGTFYRNKSNDGYLLEVNDGSNVKTYRFDKNGKHLQQNSSMPPENK